MRALLNTKLRLAVALVVALLALPLAVAYTAHLPAPPKGSSGNYQTVEMMADSFRIDGITYKRGHSVDGDASGDYYWTLTSAKGWHIFAVEDEEDVHLDLGGGQTEVPIPANSSVNVTFTVPSTCGKTWTFYCERHRNMEFTWSSAACS